MYVLTFKNIDNTTIGNDLIENDASIRVDEFSHADILQNRASDNIDIKNSESLINDTSSNDNNKFSSVLDSNNVNNITSDNKIYIHVPMFCFFLFY